MIHSSQRGDGISSSVVPADLLRWDKLWHSGQGHHHPRGAQVSVLGDPALITGNDTEVI
jgi:hypothetical protein